MKLGQRKHAARPGCVARQQDLPAVFDHRGQHRRRVVPVGPATGRAAQALLRRRLPLADQRAAAWRSWGRTGRMAARQAGNTPVGQVAVAAIADRRRRWWRSPPALRHSAAPPSRRRRPRCPRTGLPRAPGARHMSSASSWLTSTSSSTCYGRRSCAGTPAATCRMPGCASLRPAARR